MSRPLVDMTLGLNGPALAVLAMLAKSDGHGLAEYDEERQEYDLDTKTRAWYNGRERGICLEVRAGATGLRALYITFGENRSSDHIFVDSWTEDGYRRNPPTSENLPDEAYKRRKMLSEGQIGEAATYIRGLIKVFIAEEDRARLAGDIKPARRGPRGRNVAPRGFTS